MGADYLAGNVMGWGHIAQLCGAAVPDQTVAVRYAGVKIIFSAAKGCLHRFYQLASLLSGNIVGAVVLDHLIGKGLTLVTEGHQVGAQGHVAVFHINADGGGLQRAAPGVKSVGVKAQHAHIGYIGAGLQSRRYGAHQPYLCLGGQGVDMGLLCHHHGGFAAQGGHRVVCHAVAQHYNIFHTDPPEKPMPPARADGG